MIQKQFAERARQVLEPDNSVTGLAVMGSWLTTQMDEFSDLDLILVTKERVSDDKNKMLDYARRIGKLLSGFTAEHVGEPRLLVCLYDDPLLHVDIKFLTLNEFHGRMHEPVLLIDKDDQLRSALKDTTVSSSSLHYQWVEDRFWIWIHYVLQKIGRGEYMEAFDSFSDLRRMVLGPLFQMKNNRRPRGVRKVEKELNKEDLEKLMSTLPSYSKNGLLQALKNTIGHYIDLRALVHEQVSLQKEAEQKVMEYFKRIEKRED